MSDIADVPPAVVGRLRVICGELPEAYEEPAWIGLRWRIRRRTFLHVYTTDGVVRDPSALAMTVGSPPSRTETTELVVPRSMPTARAM